MRKTFLLCIFNLCFFCHAEGHGAPYIFFENISLGTEGTVPTCILQDTQGLMWIGAEKGLLSYDGYSVQAHFTPGKKNNTRINCGVVADSTRFYLGTDNGLLVYNYQRDEYEDTDTDFPPDIRTVVMYNGALWFGTLDGLYTYRPGTRKLANAGKTLPHQAVYSLLRTADNRLYVGTYDGFCRYDETTGKFVSIKLPAAKNKSNMFVNSLLEDAPNGCIWIGTEGCLYKYTPSDGSIEQINALRDNSIKSLATDWEGRLLVGTDNGLYICRGDRILQHVVHDSRNPHSLYNDIIYTIYQGREQNIWIGTDYGISLARHNNSLYHIPISQITGTGEGNQFCAMTRDGSGNFWFGGSNGLIRFTFPSEKSMERPEGEGRWDVTWYKMGDGNNPLSHNRIRRIFEDCDGNLWVAGDGSVSSYDRFRHQFTPYNIVDSTRRYNANWAYDMLEDSRGKLWIVAYLGGVFVVDRKKLLETGGGVYTADEAYTTRNGLSSGLAHSIATDKNGNVWVLLYTSNIEKINPHTGKITHVKPAQLDGGKTADCILCTSDGEMWVGYSDGIIMINPSDDSAKSMSFDVFGACEVYSMIETDKRVWISTSKGVWVSEIRSPGLHRLRLADQPFTALYFDETSNKLFMGTMDGFVVSSPDVLLEDTPGHPMLFTALYVNGKPYKTERSIRYSDRLELGCNQNNLSFELSDLPYSWEEKSRILYRLDKEDRDWNVLPAGTNRITYNNLDYGDHRLVVSKLGTDGKPSGEEYSLDIRIRPPVYYTPLAKCLYVLLTAVLLLWVARFFRMRSRLKSERAEKEKILAEARAKMDFFTNLSHDLKTPLSLIIAPLSKLIPETKNLRKREILESVHTNALRLNGLVSKILNIKETEYESENTLIRSHVELLSLLRRCADTFSPLVKEKNIGLGLESDVDSLWLNMDQLKIESVFINLISNAVKHVKDGEGRVTVSLQKTPGEVRVSVADNGTGIAEEDLPLVFVRFFQSRKGQKRAEGTGIGLYLVKKFTEMHGGQVSLRNDNGLVAEVVFPTDGDNSARKESGGIRESENSGGKELLVIDDNREMVAFLVESLSAHYRCVAAYSGEEGLAAVEGHMPDLIIVDQMMPGMDGIEFSKRIRHDRLSTSVPIIMLTAKDDMTTELESIKTGIDAFIAKPFDFKKLLLRIAQLLQKRQSIEKAVRIDAITSPAFEESVTDCDGDEMLLEKITKVIEGNMEKEDFNVAVLAEKAGMEQKQLYRKIKQLTGMSPVNYVKKLRMKKAAVLLGQNKFTISEVLYMVGYTNASYFTKSFVGEFGMTPKQFVAKSKNMEE